MDKKALMGFGLAVGAVLVAMWAANNLAPVNSLVAKKTS